MVARTEPSRTAVRATIPPFNQIMKSIYLDRRSYQSIICTIPLWPSETLSRSSNSIGTIRPWTRPHRLTFVFGTCFIATFRPSNLLVPGKWIFKDFGYVVENVILRYCFTKIFYLHYIETFERNWMTGIMSYICDFETHTNISHKQRFLYNIMANAPRSSVTSVSNRDDRTRSKIRSESDWLVQSHGPDQNIWNQKSAPLIWTLNWNP